MERSSPPHGRRPRRGRRKLNADLLRQIGEELATFRDGPPEGTFDFGDRVQVSEMSRRERMLRILWAKALDGDLKAMQMILDYTDGRPVQAMEVKASVRFTSDEYAQAEKRVAAWRASMAGEPEEAEGGPCGHPYGEKAYDSQ